MSKAVSLVNMKGGVGKSTLAANLAWHFTYFADKKVLVVDLDPQFNASQYLLGARRYQEILENNNPTVWDVFEQFTHTPGVQRPQPLDPEAVPHNVVAYGDGSRIDLVPSRLELAYSLQSPGQKEELVQRLVSKIQGQYDLILLDCPPTESMLTTAAYLASKFILVPVKPEYLSSIGLPLLVRSMREFGDRHEDHDLELAGIVFNASSDYAPEEITAKREVKEIAQANGWYVFKNEVSYSRSYPKGAREGQPIFGTSYARARQAQRFRTFAAEFAERIGL